MFENIINFFKKAKNKEEKQMSNSKSAAKERLHLVLMQDRANVSADFLELMKQEIIEVIKKYIEIDEEAIDVRLTNQENEDGTNGAPALYANIPIMNIKNEARKVQNQKDNNKKVDNEKSQKQDIEKTDNTVENKETSKTTETKVNKQEEIKQDSQKNEISKKAKKENKTEKEIEKKDSKLQENKEKEVEIKK